MGPESTAIVTMKANLVEIVNPMIRAKMKMQLTRISGQNVLERVLNPRGDELVLQDILYPQHLIPLSCWHLPTKAAILDALDRAIGQLRRMRNHRAQTARDHYWRDSEE
jgi:hypothetical protein